MCGVCAPQIRAGPRAVVGLITTGLMDPLPVQVTTEINVKFTNTAALLSASVVRNEFGSDNT